MRSAHPAPCAAAAALAGHPDELGSAGEELENISASDSDVVRGAARDQEASQEEGDKEGGTRVAEQLAAATGEVPGAP